MFIWQIDQYHLDLYAEHWQQLIGMTVVIHYALYSNDDQIYLISSTIFSLYIIQNLSKLNYN